MLAACSNDPVVPPATPPPVKLNLQRVTWANGTTENYVYSTATSVLERTEGPVGRAFFYRGTRLDKVKKQEIMIDSMYYNGNQLIQTDEYPAGQPASGLRLKFEYDGQGRLARMSYIEYGGGTATTTATITYHWNGHLPERIVRKDAATPGEEVLWELTWGPKAVPFDYWALLHRYQLIDAYTELWNLPLLASLDRLPQSVKKTAQKDGQTVGTEVLPLVQQLDAKGWLQKLKIGSSDEMTFIYQ